MVTEQGSQPARLVARLLTTGIGVVFCGVLVMWVVEITDSLLLGDRLQGNGIHPRTVGGLDGILWAPVLHSTFGHLASNSIPFAVLGWLVAVRGLRYWVAVTAIAVFVGGGLTWLLAGAGNHLGASGVVFGYFGALMGAAFYERRAATLAPALVAILLYGSILVGVVPQDRVSWEGHLFGLVAGISAGKMLARPRRQDGPDGDEIKYPWEHDEPWLE
jgi:membrane associated rhomboid family serine protease